MGFGSRKHSEVYFLLIYLGLIFISFLMRPFCLSYNLSSNMQLKLCLNFFSLKFLKIAYSSTNKFSVYFWCHI
jgi:hypothetical protein